MARKDTSEKAIIARREYTVGLKLAGVSIATIVKQVNNLATTRAWDPVTRSTVARDIADYFRKNKPISSSDYDHLAQLREAFLAQMEQTIEKASLHLVKTAKWKPFEYMDGLEKLHKMQMNYAEAQNWNMGRQNININIQQNNINKIYDTASAELAEAKPEAIKAFCKYLDSTIEKMEEDKNSAVIEGEVIEPR